MFLEKIIFFCPCRVSSSDLSFVQPVVAVIPNDPSGMNQRSRAITGWGVSSNLMYWRVGEFPGIIKNFCSLLTFFWGSRFRIDTDCEHIKCYPRRPELFARAPYVSSMLERHTGFGISVQQAIIYLLFPVALRPNAGHGLLILEVSWSHTTTRHSR